MTFQVPTPQSQDKAIASVIHHLHQSRDWPEGSTDCHRAIYSLMLKYGRTWYIGTRTFAGRRAARKQCYMNAYTLTAKDPHMVYVEGWCMAGGYPRHNTTIDRKQALTLLSKMAQTAGCVNGKLSQGSGATKDQPTASAEFTKHQDNHGTM